MEYGSYNRRQGNARWLAKYHCLSALETLFERLTFVILKADVIFIAYLSL